MAKFPSRFRRLDDILADLAVDDPLLLTELDGYLTGIAACPDTIDPLEWLPPIWGGVYGEVAPFEEPDDVRLFAEMVTARFNEILRDLGRAKLHPIYDVDERNGDVLWEDWIAGFAMAMDLRPNAWSAVLEGDDPERAAALSALLTLVDIAADDTTLTSIEVNALCDEAPALIERHVPRLRAGLGGRPDAPSGLAPRTVKIGRNDPCPCGSGKKLKRCCG